MGLLLAFHGLLSANIRCYDGRVFYAQLDGLLPRWKVPYTVQQPRAHNAP